MPSFNDINRSGGRDNLPTPQQMNENPSADNNTSTQEENDGATYNFDAIERERREHQTQNYDIVDEEVILTGFADSFRRRIQGKAENQVEEWHEQVAGINHLFVSSSFRSNYRLYIPNYLTSDDIEVNDPIRYLTGFRWKKNNFNSYENSQNLSFFPFQIKSILETGIIFKRNESFFEHQSSADVLYFSYLEKLSQLSNQEFEYFSFEVPKINFNFKNRESFINHSIGINPKYNFYHKNYEEVAEKTNEVNIPNIYALWRTFEEDEFYKQQISLNGRIFVDQNIFKNKPTRDFYFERWAYFIYNNPSLNYNIYRDIGISQFYLNYAELEQIKKNLPMYIEFSFEVREEEKDFSSKMVNLVYDDNLIAAIMSEKNNKNFISSNFLYVTNQNVEISTNELIGTQDFNFVFNRNISENAPFVMFHDWREESTDALVKSALSIEIERLSSEKKLSYLNILEGKSTYTEIIGWRLDKIKNDFIVQSFFFGHRNELFKFVDNQVSYNDYIYCVSAQILVFVEKYKYNEIIINEDGEFYVPFPKQEVAPKIFEINVGEVQSIFQDYPPLSPDPSFYTFVSDKNKLFITLNEKCGSIEEVPQIIEEEEQLKFNRIKYYFNFHDETTFRFDDNNFAYEVFKIDFEPKEIADFKGSRLIRKEANGFVLEEEIKNNKKFWYIFRSIDVHGNVSNPSKIYMIENNNEQIKTSIFELKKEIKYDKSKFMRNKMYIEAALLQLLIKDEEHFPCELGKVDEQVWNRNFKLRIRSKKSGKCFDLNLNFDKKFIDKTKDEEKIDEPNFMFNITSDRPIIEQVASIPESSNEINPNDRGARRRRQRTPAPRLLEHPEGKVSSMEPEIKQKSALSINTMRERSLNERKPKEEKSVKDDIFERPKRNQF